MYNVVEMTNLTEIKATQPGNVDDLGSSVQFLKILNSDHLGFLVSINVVVLNDLLQYIDGYKNQYLINNIAFTCENLSFIFMTFMLV